MHDLAHDALARRQVHVRLDPHAADRDPLAGGDLVGDAGEQLRLALGDPRVLLGLRAREPVVGRLVHQGHRRGERAGALAHRLARAATATPCRCGRGRWRRRGGRRTGPARRAPARRRRAPRRPRRRSRPAGGEHVEGPHDGDADARPARVVERRACASRRRGRRGRAAAPRRRGRRRTSSARSRRYSGSSPAVAGEPSGDGRNCTRIGFDAASTTSSTGPGSPRDGDGLAARVDALHRAALGVADEALALEARRVGPEAEVEERLDAPARPRRRHLAGEAEPRRAPRRPPPPRRRRTGASSSSDGPASTSRARRSGCTSGSTRSVSSRVIRSSTSSRSSCMVAHRDIPRRRRTTSSRPAPSELPGAAAHARAMDTTPPTPTITTTTTTGASSSTSARSSPGAACSACSPAARRRPRSPPAAWPARTCGGSGSTDGTGTTATTATATGTGTLTETPEETAGPYPGDGSNGVNVLTESGVVRSDIRIELRQLDDDRAGRAADDHGSRSPTPTGAALSRLRRLPLALRPRRPVLAVHGSRRELPPRRAGDGRRRHGDVHEHLPGLLRRPLAAHPLRGVPEPARRRAPATRSARRRSPCREETCAVVYATTGYEQSVRNLAAGRSTTDNVFSDGWTTAAGDDDGRRHERLHRRPCTLRASEPATTSEPSDGDDVVGLEALLARRARRTRRAGRWRSACRCCSGARTRRRRRRRR